MIINELNKLSCEVICNTEEETEQVIEMANKLGGKVVDIEDRYNYFPNITVSNKMINDNFMELISQERG
jgi:hypothetical protein